MNFAERFNPFRNGEVAARRADGGVGTSPHTQSSRQGADPTTILRMVPLPGPGRI